jgi:large subunit ribosomal protein L35
MPKMKTHKGAKKRFKVSANGKLLRKRAGKRHLNSGKSGRRKQRLRRTVAETGKVARKIIIAMGGA